MLEQPSKGEMLRVDQIHDKRLGDVEDQRVEVQVGRLRVTVACGMAMGGGGLVTEVKEVRRRQGDQDARQHPQRKGSPEGVLQEDEQVRDQEGEAVVGDAADGGEGGYGFPGEDLALEAVGFGGEDDDVDGEGGAEVVADVVCRLGDPGLVVEV